MKERKRTPEEIEYRQFSDELEKIENDHRGIGDLTVHRGDNTSKVFGFGGDNLQKAAYLRTILQTLEGKKYGTD